jgi:hypothetical protein
MSVGPPSVKLLLLLIISKRRRPNRIDVFRLFSISYDIRFILHHNFFYPGGLAHVYRSTVIQNSNVNTLYILLPLRAYHNIGFK